MKFSLGRERVQYKSMCESCCVHVWVTCVHMILFKSSKQLWSPLSQTCCFSHILFLLLMVKSIKMKFYGFQLLPHQIVNSLHSELFFFFLLQTMFILLTIPILIDIGVVFRLSLLSVRPLDDFYHLCWCSLGIHF